MRGESERGISHVTCACRLDGPFPLFGVGRVASGLARGGPIWARRQTEQGRAGQGRSAFPLWAAMIIPFPSGVVILCSLFAPSADDDELMTRDGNTRRGKEYDTSMCT